MYHFDIDTLFVLRDLELKLECMNPFFYLRVIPLQCAVTSERKHHVKIYKSIFLFLFYIFLPIVVPYFNIYVIISSNFIIF